MNTYTHTYIYSFLKTWDTLHLTREKLWVYSVSSKILTLLIDKVCHVLQPTEPADFKPLTSHRSFSFLRLWLCLYLMLLFSHSRHRSPQSLISTTYSWILKSYAYNGWCRFLHSFIQWETYYPCHAIPDTSPFALPSSMSFFFETWLIFS